MPNSEIAQKRGESQRSGPRFLRLRSHYDEKQQIKRNDEFLGLFIIKKFTISNPCRGCKRVQLIGSSTHNMVNIHTYRFQIISD